MQKHTQKQISMKTNKLTNLYVIIDTGDRKHVRTKHFARISNLTNAKQRKQILCLDL